MRFFKEFCSILELPKASKEIMKYSPFAGEMFFFPKAYIFVSFSVSKQRQSCATSFQY